MLDEPSISELRHCIGVKGWGDLKNKLATLPPADVAELLIGLEKREKILLFRCLPRDLAADIFSEMEPSNQDLLLRQLTDKETSQLLADLSPDDRAAVFHELPAQVTWKLYKLLSPGDLKEVKHILGYPEESVGRLMTPDYIAVRPQWKIKDVLEYIRKKGRDSETTSRIYVTDEKGHLLDDIRLRHIILADPEKEIKELIKGDVTTISAFEDQEKAVQLIKKLNINALPVIDSNCAMVGIVTFDDLMDVEEKEVTEDFQKIAAISTTKEDTYIDNITETPITLLYRKRIVWLVFLVFMSIFSGAATALFEGVISKYLILIFFMPLLIGSGGNAGSQASTLMVRALATGDVKQGDWAKMFVREFMVAGMLGLTMGAAVSVIGVFRGGWMISIVVVSAMFLIVVFGSLVGISLPFFFTKIGKDPAMASGPLIQSICDITGIMIYFTIATKVLGMG